MGFKFLSFCIAGLIFVFIGCGDSSKDIKQTSGNIDVQKWSEKEVQEILQLDPNESRFYVLRGYIGEEIFLVYARVGIKQNEGLYIILTIPSMYNHKYSSNESLSLPIGEYEIGLESDALIIKGLWIVKNKEETTHSPLDNKVFLLKQDKDFVLNEIDFMTASFERLFSKDGESFRYFKQMQKAFIPPNNPIKEKVRQNLNATLAFHAKDKQDLFKQLAQDTQKSFEQSAQNKEELINHIEEMQDIDVQFIDSHIIMFKIFDYIYSGGAHGNSEIATQIYSLEDGMLLSNQIEDVFDLKFQQEILALLTQKLEEGNFKDTLFEESLPLQTLPKHFLFDYRGVIFVWDIYDIAPYSSGFVKLHIDFKELKAFIKAHSHYRYLFD